MTLLSPGSRALINYAYHLPDGPWFTTIAKINFEDQGDWSWSPPLEVVPEL